MPALVSSGNLQAKQGREFPVRIRIAAVAAVAALGAAGAAIGVASAASTAAKADPMLIGKVGINDAFVITLKTSAGKKVKTLKSGFYKLKITDGSDIHNFQIEGPGLDKRVTTVSYKGTKTVRLHFRKGKYKFYCQPHESSMFGFFKVT
jgi:plastocyanin